jgi:hypothetical protein
MAKKNQPKLSQAVRDVGPVISKSEANQAAKATGKSVEQVVAKAVNAGVGVGSALTNQVSKAISSPAAQFTTPAKTLEALIPLQNLQLNKGTAYYGYSTTTTPAGSTTYNPIVLPRNTATAGGGNTTQNNDGNNNDNDPYQDLRDQIAAAQQTINDLQNQQVDPYADITNLLAEQQAADAAQREAMAAQAAQQQQALQDLMIQQQQAYETQMADARRQQEVMAAQAAEAQRQAMAVANARIPGLEPTAAAPALGDARNMTRSSATNTLSNLSILTGMGVSGGVTATPAAASPLAGLQIA